MTADLSSQALPTSTSAEGQFFAREVRPFTSQLELLDRLIDGNGRAKNDKLWIQLTDSVQRSEVACRRFEDEHGKDRMQLTQVQQRFRLETAPWLEQSWIASRVRTKPRGFPGDYRMLEAIYDHKALARGLGGYLDLYLLELPLAVAVRARMREVRRFLQTEVAGRQGDVRVLDIASGSCREYVRWSDRPNRGDLRVTCIDNDQEALDFVDANVVEKAPGITELRTLRYNALRTRSAKRTIALLGRFDIIYSVGLCDYLSDEQMIPLLQGWRDTLDENGVLYVALKDGDRYDKTPYQWHLDWHFLQRTQDDCLRLFEMAGFDVSSLKTVRDETGIIMNFVYRQVPSSIVRIDPPARSSKPISWNVDVPQLEEAPETPPHGG